MQISLNCCYGQDALHIEGDKLKVIELRGENNEDENNLHSRIVQIFLRAF
jgi:hypothetical protein